MRGGQGHHFPRGGLSGDQRLPLRDAGAKRYKSPLLLTEKGRDTGKRIAEKIDGVLETISHALTEEERIEFYRSLSTISRSLEAIVKTAKNKEM